MISGISAMMKIGNNINNMIFLSTFKRDYYFKTQLPKYDKMILSILENYSNSDSKVCEHVIEKMGNIYLIGKMERYRQVVILIMVKWIVYGISGITMVTLREYRDGRAILSMVNGPHFTIQAKLKRNLFFIFKQLKS